MLTVTLRRATASTVQRGRRLCCSTVREDSREGGRTDTHTIDEVREDPRLQVRVEVAYSMAWEGSRGAALEGGIAGAAAATPPTDGSQLSGPRRRDAASPEAPEEEAQVKAPFVDKTLLRSGSPTMLLLAARRGIGITTIGTGGIAIDSRERRAGRCYSIPCSGAPPAPSCNPEPRAHIDRRTPGQILERRENPPTPSSTNTLLSHHHLSLI